MTRAKISLSLSLSLSLTLLSSAHNVILLTVNPLTPTVVIWVVVQQYGTCQIGLSRHLSFLTSGHSDTQPWASECPYVKNYRWWLNPVWHWHRMVYSCTRMATVGVKGFRVTKVSIPEAKFVFFYHNLVISRKKEFWGDAAVITGVKLICLFISLKLFFLFFFAESLIRVYLLFPAFLTSTVVQKAAVPLLLFATGQCHFQGNFIVFKNVEILREILQ